MKITVAGENALMLYFEQQSTPELVSQVTQTARLLRHHLQLVIIDLVPSYASILIVFDAVKTNHSQVRKQIKVVLKSNLVAEKIVGKLIELPVYYDEEVAPDLTRLAAKVQLEPKQLVELHQADEYLVYAIGFAPGFAFLGQVNQRIAMPRRATPRKLVPRGAVAIADQQTAVYPMQSPGGWNLIGRCPVQLFNPLEGEAMPFEVGDRVKFVGVSRQEYVNLGGTFDRCID